MNTRTLAALLGLLGLVACNKPAEEAAPAAEAPAEAPAQPVAHEGHTDHPAAAAAGVDLPPVPEGAKVFFVAPADGARVEGALVDGRIALPVKMGLGGIAIKPAGAVEAGSGHHHVLVDSTGIPAGLVVPKDEQHLHFGKGEQEATLQLTPGEHALTLQFADGIHRSYGPQLSATIKVTVVPAGAGQPPATKP
jgi:Domain of unknown function (DUF4399)